MENSIEIGTSTEEAYNRGRVDFNFFAGLALPDVCTTALPPFYILSANIILARSPENTGKVLRFALGLPRGHAKTTFVKLLLAYLIAYRMTFYALIVGAAEGNAENILSDLSNILGSPNMEAVYGNWHANLYTDNNSCKQCMYQGSPVTLMAIGSRSSVRGININNRRPGVILCDDMQSRENDLSDTESRSLMGWFISTLLKTIDVRGDRLVIYVGNMYSDKCILKQLQDSPQWISLITGAILATGEPLWPELHSLETLLEGFMHDDSLGLSENWFAEIMNDPRSVTTSLLPKELPVFPEENFTPDGAFITIDPAGFKNTSDDNVIITHETYNGNCYIVKTDAGKYNPKEVIEIAFKRAFEYNASVIGVEAVAYQSTLRFWIQYFIRTLDISGIEVVELSPRGASKESRIRLFIQELYLGTYRFKTAEEKAIFTWQAMAYKIGKKNNKDDILDAQSYGLDMRADHWHLIKNNAKLEERPEGAEVVVNNTPF